MWRQAVIQAAIQGALPEGVTLETPSPGWRRGLPLDHDFTSPALDVVICSGESPSEQAQPDDVDDVVEVESKPPPLQRVKRRKTMVPE